jgi:hypothetical protein
MQQIDHCIERYLTEMDTADRQQSDVAEVRTARLSEKIKTLKAQMEDLKQIQGQLEQTPVGQISLTDPDARAMATSTSRGLVGYNVQPAVDTTHHLIVAHEVRRSFICARRRSGLELFTILAALRNDRCPASAVDQSKSSTIFAPASRTTGEQIVSFIDFAQGRPVKEIRRAAADQYAQIMQRVTLSVQNPGQCRLLDRNCETYATWLIGEKPQSPQVLGVVALGLIAAFLRFA